MADTLNRVALITGGTRGIGFGIAKVLAADGYYLALNGVRDEAKVKPVLEELKDLGVEALYVQGDIGAANDREGVLDGVQRYFGRLDILVCCAGIMPKGGMDVGTEQWERVNKVNVDGTYYCIAAAWPHMVAAAYGKIVTIASMAAHQGGLAIGPEYSTSKGAVVALTRHTARNGGPHNIYCNTVSPGVIATDLNADFNKPPLDAIPLGRIGDPEDVAEPIRFLCSPASNYVTGAVLPISGGIFFGL